MGDWFIEHWFPIVMLGALLTILGFAFTPRPQRCGLCLRRFGPPTAAELSSGQTIGCPLCNHNLPDPLGLRGTSIPLKPEDRT